MFVVFRSYICLICSISLVHARARHFCIGVAEGGFKHAAKVGIKNEKPTLLT